MGATGLVSVSATVLVSDTTVYVLVLSVTMGDSVLVMTATVVMVWDFVDTTVIASDCWRLCWLRLRLWGVCACLGCDCGHIC